MYSALAVALTPLVLLALLLLHHAFRPASQLAVVLSLWQTLAAALIGFSSLAAAFVLQSRFDRQEKNHEQLQLDWAVVTGVQQDLAQLSEELDFLLEFTTPTSDEDWEEITEDVFRKVFKKSAVKRTKFEGLKRNIQFLKE